MVWHETCKCVCWLTSAICNTRQIWNKDKCQCECKEDLIPKLTCDKGYIWNPSTCVCECDKFCDVGQYLDYKNCVCRKSVIDRLVEECINVVDEGVMQNKTGGYLDDFPSNTRYTVLFTVFLLAALTISGVFVYYRHKKLDLKKDAINVNYSMAGTSLY